MANLDDPRVFLDVDVSGKPVGRIVIELYAGAGSGSKISFIEDFNVPSGVK